jgi:protein TonB
MTTVSMLARPRHWVLALGAALLLHAGLAVVFHQLVDGGAAKAGRGGVAVGLPPAGAAPGAPAAAEANEAAEVAPPEVAEVPPAAVPEAAPVPEVETADVPPPEAATPPDAEALYAPEETVEAPPEPVEVPAVEPVEVAEAEPVEETVTEPAMAVPAPPKAKPEPPVTEVPVETAEAVPPAPEAGAVESATQTAAAAPQDGSPAADDELVGNRGKAGSGARAATGAAEGHSGGGAPGAFVDYKAQLLAWLEKHKEYPRRARLRRQEGTALLEFVMDRTGRVLEYRIVESSGYKLLDEEVVAMIERASPLPTPPAAMAGESFNYTVPIWFNQR